MPSPPDHEETLFLAAREIADPAQRAAFLDRACRSDTALRQRLERLLAVDAPAAELWADDPPTSDQQTIRIEEPEPVAEGPGSVIGRYKLLEQIGEGGMGVVSFAAGYGWNPYPVASLSSRTRALSNRSL
jgi:eukaryotic-like serine/threonine-protein kinase